MRENKTTTSTEEYKDIPGVELTKENMKPLLYRMFAYAKKDKVWTINLTVEEYAMFIEIYDDILPFDWDGTHFRGFSIIIEE